MKNSGAKLGNFLRMKYRRRMGNSRRWISRALRRVLDMHSRIHLQSGATQKKDST
ncbi:hypothetical protein FHS20_004254 [Phyllobacterium endophyticum]|nr:hypothetical protein [Phyllobacterium endophyticum]